MQIAEVMTIDPLTVGPDDTIGQAEEIMNEHRIRQLPIVVGKELVGILSQRDLFGAAVGKVFNLRAGAERELLKSFRIEEVMHKRVVTAAPHMTIQEAARLMAEKKIGCLPVVEGGELVGLVTSTNILRYLSRS